MCISRRLIMLCAAVSMGTAVVGLAGGNSQGSADVESARKSGEILPQEEIIQRAKSQHPGRVTEIELEHKHGRYVYEVDVVDESSVKWELKFDAKTGDLISSEADEDDETNGDDKTKPDN